MRVPFNNMIVLFHLAAPLMALLILVNADRLGEVLGVMDHPDTDRKLHERSTPLMCGLAIIVPLFFWCCGSLLFDGQVDALLVTNLLLCGGAATLVGLADDQSPISPGSRLLFLFLLSSIVLVIEPSLLPTRLSWGTLYSLPLAPWVGFAFVVIALTGFVNAVNMADGQNGIVIGMFMIWSICLALHTGGSTQGAALILLETAFVAFILNVQGRSFLGDSGTYGIGFVVGTLAIWAHNGWGVQAETIAVWFFVPVFDCLRLIVSRAYNGRTPFGSGRDHFHHKLEDRVGKTYGLVLYLAAIGGTSITATLVPSLSFLCLISLMVFYFSFLVREPRRSRAATDFGDGNVVVLERPPANDRAAEISARRALRDD